MTYPRRQPAFYLATLAFALQVAAGEPTLHLPFEGGDRVIRDVGGEAIGLHYPSSIADQDDAASIAPERFRGEARYGKGIRYFGEDRSFTRIEEGPDFDEPIEAVAISLEMKVEDPGKNRFAALVTNRLDSHATGFSLFLWGNQLRFSFGDGETVHDLRANAPQLKDGEWHSVQAAFERGRAALWVDGTRLKTQNFDAAAIAPPQRELHLGGYPADNQGRSQYAYDGWLDEIAIGGTQAPLVKYLETFNAERANFAPPPPIRTTLLPVDGSEPFFGGQRVFHSFRTHPVPMTFLFSADPKRIEGDAPRLVFYLPPGVELAVAHQSNHNEPDGAIEWDVTEVERGGQSWKRYASRGLDLAKGGGSWKRGGPFVSLAFEADESVDEAVFVHALEHDGTEGQAERTTLRFLDPPPAVPEDERGRFQVFGYVMMTAFAYPDRELWAPTAEMLSRVGLTGKGRFYSDGAFRGDFDDYLRDRGFTLYEIGLWHGPDPYEMALDPEGMTESYVSARKGRMAGLREGEPVLFDYEPWRLTYKSESFAREIREVFAERAGLEATPTAEDIRARYRSEWLDFWLGVGNDVYGAMGEVVRTHHPDPDAPRVSYTYFFPYDDEEALQNRFWSVPKDPRRAEASDHVDVHLISLYHTNDRKLVDQVRLSKAHLDRPIWGIPSVGRVNPVQNFATPENSLPPERIEQKFVLCAALGMERLGIWPGRGWIDAAYLSAIGNASRFIWRHEDYYFDGAEDDGALSVSPEAPSVRREDWAHTVHRHEDGRLLLSVFNFTDGELAFRAVDPDTGDTAELAVAPRGYATHAFGAEPLQSDSRSTAQ